MYVKDDTQLTLFLMALIEDVLIQGIGQSILDNVITEEEGYKALELARLQLDIPGLFRRYHPTLRKEIEEMSDLNQVILFKDKDQLIPREFIDVACRDFGKSIGAVVLKDDNIIIQKGIGDIKPDKTAKNAEDRKAFMMLMVFNKIATKTEDIPVFPIVVVDGKTLLAGILQGDPSAIPDIIKKVGKLHTIADSMKEFLDDAEKSPDIIKGILKDDSCFILLAHTGDMLTFDKNSNIEKNFDWGAYYAGADAAKLADTPAGDEPKTAYGDLGSFTDDVNTEVVNDPPPKDDKKTALQRPQGATTIRIRAADFGKLDKELMSRVKIEGKIGVAQFKSPQEPHYQIPHFVSDGKGGQRVIHKNEADALYEKHVGLVPENWGENPKPMIPASFLKVPFTSMDLKALRDGTAMEVLGKDTAARHAGPMPDDSTLKGFISDLPRVFGANTEQITNPAKLYEEEVKRPTVAEMTKRDPEAYHVGHTGRYYWVTHHALIASNLWGDEIRRNYELKKKVSELEKLLEEATKPKEKSEVFDSFT